MSEETVPRPGAEDDWEPIDEAVRDHYGEALTAGTNLFDGSDLMGRLDPLSVFRALAAYGSPLHPTRQVGRCHGSRRRGDASRDDSCDGARGRRHPVVPAGTWQGQTFRRSGLDRECRLLVAQGDLSRLGTVAARNHQRHRHPACSQAKSGVRHPVDDRRAGSYQLHPDNPR